MDAFPAAVERLWRDERPWVGGPHLVALVERQHQWAQDARAAPDRRNSVALPAARGIEDHSVPQVPQLAAFVRAAVAVLVWVPALQPAHGGPEGRPPQPAVPLEAPLSRRVLRPRLPE
jgi:hypothetical protein